MQLIDKYKILHDVWFEQISAIAPFKYFEDAYLAVKLEDDIEKDVFIEALDDLGSYELVPDDDYVIFRFL